MHYPCILPAGWGTSSPWCSTKSSGSYSKLNSLLFPNTRSSRILHFCYTIVIQLVIQVWLFGPSLTSHLWFVSRLCDFVIILLQFRLSSSLTGTVSSFPGLFLPTWMLLFPIFGAGSRVTFLRCRSPVSVSSFKTPGFPAEGLQALSLCAGRPCADLCLHHHCLPPH